MGVAAISLPSIIFMFPGASIAMLHQRWDDWVARDATVTTRKDQAEDTAGVSFELLRTRIVLRPALTPLVAIAEPRLEPVQSVPDKLIFKPFNPWLPLPVFVGARFADGDPDTIWLIPRDLTVDDF
jgi:hypothetical protein